MIDELILITHETVSDSALPVRIGERTENIYKPTLRYEGNTQVSYRSKLSEEDLA